MRDTDARDLSKQKAVRERLHCKGFDWFMKEIAFDQDKFYPAVEPPDGAKGEIRNKATSLCVDTQFKGKVWPPSIVSSSSAHNHCASGVRPGMPIGDPFVLSYSSPFSPSLSLARWRWTKNFSFRFYNGD